MSLDVYLTLPTEEDQPTGSGIFVREDGVTKEISRAEWDEKFPGREPVVLAVDEHDEDDNEVYSANITHNLGRMAAQCDLYDPLWHPENTNATKASQLIKPICEGLALLESDPERFKEFNPKNGWGDYDALVGFARKYLAACVEYPEADIYVSV